MSISLLDFSAISHLHSSNIDSTLLLVCQATFQTELIEIDLFRDYADLKKDKEAVNIRHRLDLSKAPKREIEYEPYNIKDSIGKAIDELEAGGEALFWDKPQTTAA